MNRFLVLFCVIGCSLAAPYGQVKTQQSQPSTVAILKHIQQINDDGSYTFGYENADGSYRVENRDVNGYITGKYGYIDATGKLQETEYVAGKLSGRSVGYQARGNLIPIFSREQQTTFPIVRTVSTEQRTLDYEYKSVDEDEDGFPDEAPVVKKTTAYEPAPVVVRVVDSKEASYQPTSVRVVEKVTSTAKVDSYGSKTASKVTAPAKTEKVQVVKTEYSSPASTVVANDAVITEVRVSEAPLEVVEAVPVESTPEVRVVESVQYVQQPTVVRLVATEQEQTAKQAPQLYKVNQSVFRVPNAYETVQQPEKAVEKTVSVGRLDTFLRELVKSGNVKIVYQQQPKTVASYYSQPSTVETTVLTDDDSIDIEAFGRII